MKITLDKAIIYNKTEYKELEFDLESLTGEQLIKARAFVNNSNTFSMDALTPQLSMEYQARVAAEAADVPYEVVAALPAKKFMQVANAVRDFLIEQV